MIKRWLDIKDICSKFLTVTRACDAGLMIAPKRCRADSIWCQQWSVMPGTFSVARVSTLHNASVPPKGHRVHNVQTEQQTASSQAPIQGVDSDIRIAYKVNRLNLITGHQKCLREKDNLSIWNNRLQGKVVVMRNYAQGSDKVNPSILPFSWRRQLQLAGSHLVIVPVVVVPILLPTNTIFYCKLQSASIFEVSGHNNFEAEFVSDAVAWIGNIWSQAIHKGNPIVERIA